MLSEVSAPVVFGLLQHLAQSGTILLRTQHAHQQLLQLLAQLTLLQLLLLFCGGKRRVG